LFALLLTAHLFQSGVLWGEEDLPLAAASRMAHGATLYRDVWFDKPPLVPAVYLLWGVRIGAVLRIAGAVYALLACVLAYALARKQWSEREGFIAAGLLGFFLTFDTHSAIVPLAADLLLLVPHLASLWLVARKQFFLGGIAAGLGFLCNAKGVFVLAACALFGWRSLLPIAAGFVLTNVAALGWLTASGAFPYYIDQVWTWPAQYAGSPVVADPVWNGVIRTANWLGFHAALVVGAACWLWKQPRPPWRFLGWIAVAIAGVVLGWRFFPRYYFLLLAPMTVVAARGLAVTRNRVLVAIALLTMLVPLVRFGPRYATVANSSDLAMDRDSRAASRIAVANAPPGSSLYVWGYRPEDYVYTNLPPATRFLDCQAMTGVPADRHLTQSTIVLTSGTEAARAELARSQPGVVIDGLSLYNPALSMSRYPDLRVWLEGYREVARTTGSIVYVRRRTAAAIATH
jgi:hypothetical protein